MLRPATPLSVLLFAAFVLLLLSVLSTPIIKGIPLATYQGTNYGVFGYCKGSKCTGIEIGYAPDTSSSSSFSLPSSTRHSLSAILIVHPIAALLTLISFVLALAAHLHSPSHSPRYLLGLLILLIPTLLVSLLAFLVDILLFVPHLQWGGWIVLAATIILTACGVITCAMQRTLVSRKARKRRIAENAEMSGENYYGRQNAAVANIQPVPQPSTTVANSTADGDKLPSFATYDSSQTRRMSDEENAPLNNRTPSTRTAATSERTTGLMEDGVERYGDPAFRRPYLQHEPSDPRLMRPPMPGPPGFGRGAPSFRGRGRGGPYPRGGGFGRGPYNGNIPRGPPNYDNGYMNPGRGMPGPYGPPPGPAYRRPSPGPASNYDYLPPQGYGYNRSPRMPSPAPACTSAPHSRSISEVGEPEVLAVQPPQQMQMRDSDPDVIGVAELQQQRQDALSVPMENMVSPTSDYSQNPAPVELPASTSPPPSAPGSSTGYYEDVEPRFAEPAPTLAVPRPALPGSLRPGHHRADSVHSDSRMTSYSYEDMPVPDYPRSPAESEMSNFTSISQRGINPRWRPPPPGMVPGVRISETIRAARQREDIILNSNPDFELPLPRGGRRGGMRSKGTHVHGGFVDGGRGMPMPPGSN